MYNNVQLFPCACSDLSKIKNVEAFFPGEYSQLHYDGPDPINGWTKVEPQLRVPPIFNASERTAIPIYTLSHVTHSDQALQIKSKDEQQHTVYTFIPKPKCGKQYDSTAYRSYKKVDEDKFQNIKHDEQVIEGNLSWWGVDTHSWYNSLDDRGKAFGDAVATLRSDQNRVFVSPFMSNPPESPYGDRGFVVRFKDLLNSYKESRTDIVNAEDRALFLRIGGTLRYRNEICYVVIVCTKHDNELEHYPSLDTRRDIFDHNGLLHHSGKIKKKFFASEETIDFKIRYAIKCVPIRQYFSYEAPAFAFYYPKEGTSLECRRSTSIVTEDEMRHQECNRCPKRTKTSGH